MNPPSSRGANTIIGTFALGDIGEHNIYSVRNNSLQAQRLDLATARVQGTAVTVLEDVALGAGGAARAALSSSGALVYRGGARDSRLVFTDGHSPPLAATPERGVYLYPRISPTGDRIAFSVDAGILDNRVYRVSTSNGEITGHFVTGVYSHDNKISKDGKLVYNSSIGALAALPRAPNSPPLADKPGANWQLTIVDVNTLATRDRIVTEHAIRPWHFASDEKGLYAQLGNQHAVAYFDFAARKFTRHLELPVKAGITTADYDFEAPHHGLGLTD